MRFTETELPGVFVIDLDSHSDERGSFCRVFGGIRWPGPVRVMSERDRSFPDYRP